MYIKHKVPVSINMGNTSYNLSSLLSAVSLSQQLVGMQWGIWAMF